MPSHGLMSRTTVRVATSGLVAYVVLALLVVACASPPADDPTAPTGGIGIDVTVVGDGRVAFDAAGFTCRDECTLFVDDGSDVAIVAQPHGGSVLVAWDGPCPPFGDTCTWRADRDVAVRVTFAPHALRFDLEGDGEGYFQIAGGGIDVECRGACFVTMEQPLTMAVQYWPPSSTRTTLDPWTGACAGATDPTYCLVAVDGATTIGKTWRHPPIARDHAYATNQRTALTVDAPGVLADVDDTPDDTHTASLASEPDNGAIDVDPDGSFTYTPNVGFAGTDTFTFRVADAFGNTDEGVATITVRPRLTLTRTGQGIVTIEPGDIVCDASCETVDVHADVGATVTLLATPEPGHVLQGWSGDACDGSNELTCQVTLSAEARVTANFIGVTSVLEVFRDGTGTGNITSDPGTIDLNAGQTSDEFDHGTQITLTATPDDGNTFTSWSGGPCDGSTDPTCTVTINEPTTITATFTLNTYTLTVDRDGTGTGTITSDPSAINVTPTQASDDATFNHGEEITLTANPATGSTFTNWSGVTCDDGNTTNPCTFTITNDTTITATFTLNTYTLTVDRDGTGNITSDPGTINLNAGQTSDEFDHGTQITLTATPDDGNTFDGWSAGPCDGELDTTCTFTIDSTTVVTATFSPEVRTLSVTTSGTGNGNVTSEPSGIDVNRGTDSATFDDGTEITLTATPTGSSVFTEWTSGPCAGSIETTCTFTLTEDTAVTATFTRRRLLLGDAGHANDRVASATAALPRTRS